MSHESEPRLRHSEVQTAIDEAAVSAAEAGRHYREGKNGNYEEQLVGYNPLEEDALSSTIQRQSNPLFGEKTKTQIRANHPRDAEDYSYRRPHTDYDSRISHQVHGQTRIKRYDQQGNLVYEHETKDIQLARRLAKLAAKSIDRQSKEESEKYRLWDLEARVADGEVPSEELEQELELKGFEFVTNEPNRFRRDRRPVTPRLRQEYGAKNVYTGTAFDIYGKPINGMHSVYRRVEGEQKAA